MDIRPIFSSLRQHKITVALLILEIAFSCAIVCNAMFLVAQRWQRMHLPSGIAEHELLQIQLGGLRRPADAEAQTLTDLAALRQISGVREAGMANALPFSGGGPNSDLMLSPQQSTRTLNLSNYFGQNLLPTLGIQLLAGRDFQADEYIDQDRANAALHSDDRKGLPQSLMISQAVAQRLWPGQSALGKTVYFGHALPFRVSAVYAAMSRSGGLFRGWAYSMILPISVHADSGARYVIRCAPADRDRILRAAVAVLKQAGPHRVVLSASTYDQLRAGYFADDRAMLGLLLGTIAALLTVTALGIVGLASFWVLQRRRMIGIRRALGARSKDILHYFQLENALIVGLGIGAGMVLACGLNQWLMLHYELPGLPWYYLPWGAICLWGLGQLAVLAPARRAAAVAPVAAMRSGLI
ncbi:ABC transporter permease [Frateuria aurantia]|uniref:ABC-type antimicrobial peptide transport system, permease component n=1 Tax=Frateuria aurantia (strain ATCC 33424 / DSM 6220 / KCTC 2777 / LMG 1558 / NBRC 3245 / NCIMB 13370) TaxID=767434 RepID=H8L071_FRAAD|nr:FtsX-like permease family protein [Frateuria aurantia]AFC87109.1 ABC-type antimicrobial peptide transport system, permease component [Frateuria aurantia DSM 6220]